MKDITRLEYLYKDSTRYNDLIRNPSDANDDELLDCLELAKINYGLDQDEDRKLLHNHILGVFEGEKHKRDKV